jgi:carbon storage regulator
MLALNRYEGESIDIAGGAAAGGITVKIVAVMGSKVRLAIDAPKDISVHRSEVQDRVDRNEPRKPQR